MPAPMSDRSGEGLTDSPRRVTGQGNGRVEDTARPHILDSTLPPRDLCISAIVHR